MTELSKASIVVLIPAYNEQDSITRVIADIPKTWVEEVVVVDNQSSDATASHARSAGATVLHQALRGYGNACLLGIQYLMLERATKPDVVVFMDADYSDYPEQLPLLVLPILQENKDLVIGSRTLGKRERGSLTPQQVFGNWLATFLIRILYGFRYTDLGPFRAIRYSKLIEIDMQDRTYGWTVEMQLKAIQHHLSISEVPVNYRKRRTGVSKVAGTVKGTILAGYKIIQTILKYRF